MRKKIIIIVALLVVLQVVIYIVARQKKENIYGKITTSLRVYENANKGITDVNLIPISTLYFVNEILIEELPQEYYSERYCLIRDNQYSDYYISSGDLLNKQVIHDVSTKDRGALFVKDTIPFYMQRVNMTDTLLNGINYKRFYINTEKDFAVFYIEQSSKKLPYTLNKLADLDYSGNLSRIDTYQREEDRFTSFRMHVTDTIPEKIYQILNEIR